MKKLDTGRIWGLRSFAYNLDELKKIARKICAHDVRGCNTGNYNEKAVKELMARAQEIAGWYGLIAYHQSDPRGCSLYLINKKLKKSGNYCYGIAIC